jgi:uncharacterized protein YbjQ (UPF0145 family)
MKEVTMLVSTTNDLPGFTLTETLGEVFGLTVRTRNVGAQLGAALKGIVGGELAGLTKQLEATRAEAMARMIQAATERGADAVVAMRFDSNEIGGTFQEVVAYGTAVKATPIS